MAQCRSVREGGDVGVAGAAERSDAVAERRVADAVRDRRLAGGDREPDAAEAARAAGAATGARIERVGDGEVGRRVAADGAATAVRRLAARPVADHTVAAVVGARAAVGAPTVAVESIGDEIGANAAGAAVRAAA